MEKRVVEYSEFKSLCLRIADEAKNSGIEFRSVMCILRGGLTASHIIAKRLLLPVSVVSPVEGLAYYAGWGPVLVVDDMCDQGRTFDRVKSLLSFSGIAFKTAAVFNVGDYPVDFVGEYESDKWLVMPNEEADKCVVGDKGLFSQGSSRYGE